MLVLGVALAGSMFGAARVSAQPWQDGDGQPNGGPPVYQQHALMGIDSTGIGAMSGGIDAIFDVILGSRRRRFRRVGFSDLILITWTTTRCGMAAVTRRISATCMERRRL